MHFPPALPRNTRAALPEHYRRFFVARNGEPDLEHRQLPRRETASVRWKTKSAMLAQTVKPPISREAFDRLRSVEGASSETNPLLRWLVSLSKANESEAWGVDYLLSRAAARDGSQDTRRLADLEEIYHTEALRHVVRSFGLDFELSTPPFLTRTMIRAMAHVPDRLSNVFLVLGEVMGVIAFEQFLDDATDAVGAYPDHLPFAQELLSEILVDELGHVNLMFARMTRTDLVISRCLLPLVFFIIRSSFLQDDEDVKRYREALARFDTKRFPGYLVERSYSARNGIVMPQRS